MRPRVRLGATLLGTAATVALAALLGCRSTLPTSPRSAGAPVAATIPSSEPVGADRPMVIGQTDPEGRWVFFCQVMRDTDHDGRRWGGASNHGLVGDAFEPQLWFEGRTVAIDGFLGASPDGHWIALREGNAMALLDARTGGRTRLAIAPAADPYSFAPSVDFAEDGARMLYVRATRDGGEVVVRELASGRERSLRAASGLLWRARFDRDGEHVWAEVVTTDSDGDGALSLPRADTNLVVGQCMSSGATSTWGAWSGDAPVLHTAREGTTLEPTPGGIAYLDGGLIARDPSGALASIGRVQREVAPAACRAQVVHLDLRRRRLLFVCTGQANTVREELSEMAYRIDVFAPAFRWDGGEATPLGFAIQIGEHDSLHHGIGVTRIHGGGELDYDTGAAKVEPRNVVVATHGDRGLVVLRDGTPCVIALEGEQRRCFAGRERIDPSFYGSEMLQGGPVVMTPIGERRGAVVDLAAERVLGYLPDRGLVHAVDAHGRVLVGARDDHGVLVGPIRWQPLDGRDATP